MHLHLRKLCNRWMHQIKAVRPRKPLYYNTLNFITTAKFRRCKKGCAPVVLCIFLKKIYDYNLNDAKVFLLLLQCKTSTKRKMTMKGKQMLITQRSPAKLHGNAQKRRNQI